MAIEYAETSDEDVTGEKEKWREITAAHQKMFELEELSFRFKLQMATTISVLLAVIGSFATFSVHVFDHKSLYNLSPLAWAGGFIGIFLLGVSLVQLVIVLWEIRKSQHLRKRLAQAVDEASGEYNNTSAYLKRG